MSKKTSTKKTHRHAPSRPHHVLLYVLLFIGIFGLTYFISSRFDVVGTTQPVEVNTETSLMGTYTGTTPCADCPGIKTELTLNENNAGYPTTYSLKMDYIDRDVVSTETGKWTQSVWKKNTLITLVPSGSAQVTYYIVLGPNEIRQLDGDRNPIPEAMPFTLTKQQ